MNELKKVDIEEKLMRIGVPAGYSGFEYIADYVLLYFNEKMTEEKMNVMYMTIAKLHNVSIYNVERNIRFVLNASREIAKESLMNYYFGTIKENRHSLQHFVKMIQIDIEHAISSISQEVPA